MADTRGGQLLRIEPDGTDGRSVARRGQGPGEIRTPIGLAITKDGRPLVGDLVNANLQLLSADGKLIAATQHPGVARLRAFHWLTGDEFIGAPSVFIVSGGARLSTDPDGQPVDRIPLIRFVVRTTAEPTTVAHMPYHPAPRHTDQLTPHAFRPPNAWHAQDGRIAVADGWEYAVRMLDAAGRETGRITRPIEPREPSRADVDAARAEARARLITRDGRPRIGGVSMSGGPPRPPDPREQLGRVERALDAMTHEDRVPVVQDVRFDADGRLWVARTPAVWGQPPLLDVFSPGGEYLGTTQALPRLPDAFGPGGLAAFIEKDELDVPFVIVRRFALL
jgi:hypothetical protein